jgi:predicted nucleotidyltransferase
MRITNKQRQGIKNIVTTIAGSQATIILFGSRVDDSKKGGDVDILVDLKSPVSNPALLAATLSAEISSLMLGRKVDVVLEAPNLNYLAVHKYAHLNGITL